MIAPIQAWFGWLATERALRLGRPLPTAWVAVPTTLAITSAGVVVLLAVARR
jgi:putative membrane protein